MPSLGHLVGDRDEPDLSHVLGLLLEGLHEVFVVLEATVVQRLDVVAPVDVFELLSPLVLCVHKLGQFSAEAGPQLLQVLPVEVLGGQHRDQGIAILLLPVIHQRSELVPREFVLEAVLLREAVKALYFRFDDAFAPPEVLDLRVELVHLVLILEDQVFVDISHLELEILATHRLRQVVIVQKGAEVVLIFGVHFRRANWHRKIIGNLEVARVVNLCEALAVWLVPRLQQISVGSALIVAA